MAYKDIAEKKGGSVQTEHDLVGFIWKERPAFPKHAAFILDENYAGVSATEKQRKLRDKMAQKQADIHILTSLYS